MCYNVNKEDIKMKKNEMPQISIRIHPDKKKELELMLVKRGIKLQKFLEDYIDQELAKEKEGEIKRR